jgi:cell division transport system permease protein
MPNTSVGDQALEEFQQQSGLGEALRELPENPLRAWCW